MFYNDFQNCKFLYNILYFMENLFYAAEKLGVCRLLDIYFAKMVVKNLSSSVNKDKLMLVSFCVSMYHGKGHVCLPIRFLDPLYIFDGKFLDLSEAIWNKVGNLSIYDWKEIFFVSSIVGYGLHVTPLVFDNENIYLYRMWKCECIVADFFSKSNIFSFNVEERLRLFSLLNKYFSEDSFLFDNDINWQKIAVFTSLMYKVSIICGGPGTGKTYIISKLLSILLDFYGSSFRIVMAAPTAKSALKMTESLNVSVDILSLNLEQRRCLPKVGITIHSLLNKYKYFYCKDLFCDIYFSGFDILIIDEVSMVDLNMMSDIISFLPSDVRVVFLGDHYQLPSIEAGSVLSDICEVYNFGCSFKKYKNIFELTGFKVDFCDAKNNIGFSDNICFLNKSFRFHVSSDIYRLSNEIKSGNYINVLMLLKSSVFKNISYFFLEDFEMYKNMLMNFVNFYKKYFSLVNRREKPYIILNMFNRFRILCVLRDGPFGVIFLNCFFEQILKDLGLIFYNKNYDKNYLGRPIMILKNTPSLDLYNGDIGIILSISSKDDDYEVYFYSSVNKRLKKVLYSFLPKHETSFVMTIHKSQGLEFSNVLLVLPNCITSLLTRELLYTAVTRSKKYLTIYGTDSILQYCIKNKINRISGLVNRIKGNIM
ncbi:MAG: exodeoxyribonuclease V subunit RecD [Candidatus Westeberhardia cardiocondylae]|nr:exodeoxyribonuclease V subunit RecD [Candidatus Westeberhardia cardiocondylae]